MLICQRRLDAILSAAQLAHIVDEVVLDTVADAGGRTHVARRVGVGVDAGRDRAFNFDV